MTTKILGLSLIFSVLLDSYTLKVPEYQARKVVECVVKAETAGLAIGAQPIQDVAEQRQYFGTELSQRGYEPVFIVIQNQTDKDSFLFDKSKMTYGAVGKDGLSPKIGSKKTTTFLIIGAAGSIPFALIGAKMAAKASEIQQHMLNAEIQSKTLPPGNSVHGFVYVPINKGEDHVSVRIEVPITKSGSVEETILSLTL